MAANDNRGIRYRHRRQYGHNRVIIPITDLAFGERGVIAFIKGDKKVVQRLSDLGLTLHTEVEMLRKAPINGPIEVCVRRTKLAIAHEIADNIFVYASGRDDNGSM